LPDSFRSQHPGAALVFAGNDRYARGLAVAIHSSLTHLSGRVAPEIYILDDGLSDVSRARLRRVIDGAGAPGAVHWVADPRRAFGARRDSFATRSPTYLRLLIAEILPRHIARAVYLDADVFIRRDLTPLLTTDLDGAPLGAVRDYAIDTTAHPWAQIEGGTQARPYLNAGVLVIDVPLWRRTGLGDRALRYVEDHGESPSWDDQGALNAVIDRWHELDPIWNVQLLNLAVMERLPATTTAPRLIAQRRTLMREGAVLHFVGPSPWSTTSTVRGTGAWVITLLHSGWYAPHQAATWLVPWLCLWIPRRCAWLMRRMLLRVIGGPSVVRAYRVRLGRRVEAAATAARR
jgi:lipopolysaccharide biosynthesis glycosyltransferase